MQISSYIQISTETNRMFPIKTLPQDDEMGGYKKEDLEENIYSTNKAQSYRYPL